MDIKDKVVLITGGTGSLGYGLVERLLPIVKEIKILSRDESKQDAMKTKYPTCKYILGDVRDLFALKDAFRGVDIVIHAAAFKYLDISEYQPRECVLTNVVGSLNVIEAAKAHKIPLVVGISTDKAPYARNVYGCTKQIMERLFKRETDNTTKFIICRYGNVIGTNGSIIPKWKKLVEEGKDLIVTNKNMRRFFFTVSDAVDLILEAVEKEKFFNWKEMKVARMWDIALEVADGKVSVIEGELRLGEKIDETLIADYEGEEKTTANSEFMTQEEIKKIINEI